MKILRNVAAVVLAGILIFSGVDKVLHWTQFLLSLIQYRFLPPGGVEVVACLVVGSEICIGLALLIPRLRRAGLAGAALLFGSFTMAVTYLTSASPGAPCGCTFLFGPGGAGVAHIGLTVVLSALSGALYREESPSSNPRQSLMAPDLTTHSHQRERKP